MTPERFKHVPSLERSDSLSPLMRTFTLHPAISFFIVLACFAGKFSLNADPLTKQLDIDFGRDVASRNHKGLATRSDGRVMTGPVFTDLDGPK